ncbi:MAG: DUF1491 family protein [Dongiaceae bacterium]
MSEARLPTELWVKAHLRRCTVEGIPATLVRRGAQDGATVLVKINQHGTGCRVFSQVRDLDGRLGWLPALAGRLVEEIEADAYVRRAVDRDPDLWVIEIENRDGGMPFEGGILT